MEVLTEIDLFDIELIIFVALFRETEVRYSCPLRADEGLERQLKQVSPEVPCEATSISLRGRWRPLRP